MVKYIHDFLKLKLEINAFYNFIKHYVYKNKPLKTIIMGFANAFFSPPSDAKLIKEIGKACHKDKNTLFIS